MNEDQNILVEELRTRRAAALAAAREAVLGWLEPEGREGYSKQFKLELELEMDIQHINKMLRAMEGDGLLLSRLQYPPHPDRPGGGGMSRRYYRKVRHG